MANALDRFILAVSPSWGLRRMRARAAATVLARHYEAAESGRRTQNWRRSGSDANMAAAPALSFLRAHSRDLVRNNSWASNGIGVISDHIVGWGIVAKALAEERIAKEASAAWSDWSESTACDADGRLTFPGLQALSARSVAESGELLLRRRWRRPADGVPLNFQVQLLEPDFIDTGRNAEKGQEGGPIVQGIEFDAIGRRTAYWLFEVHPGSGRVSSSAVSKRVSASEIIHAYRIDRPGQVRGVPWLASAILGLKDFDEFEDAQLMRQKIAACFAAFVKDVAGDDAALGEKSTTDALLETIEPGLVNYLPAGRDVTFGNPPMVTDDGFSTRTLRKIAAGLRTSYEDLTGDYSQVNFSSARMARLKHWAAVYSWRYHMLIPHVCQGVWGWAMEAAVLGGVIPSAPKAIWTPPPMPMIEPDKEGLALMRMVRAGAKTFSEMIREQGYDPDQFLAEYSADLAKLDALGIKLDSDVRAVSQAGLTQERVGGSSGGSGSGEDERAGGSVVVNVVPDHSEELGSRIAEALRAGRAERTVQLKRDDKGRIDRMVVAEEG